MSEQPVPSRQRAHEDPPVVRAVLITLTVVIIGFLVIVPLVNVFVEAFAGGARAYWNNLVNDADTLSAIRLTLTVAPIAVAFNLVFGVAAAWAIARFRF